VERNSRLNGEPQLINQQRLARGSSQLYEDASIKDIMMIVNHQLQFSVRQHTIFLKY